MVAIVTIYATALVLLLPGLLCNAQVSGTRQYLELGDMYYTSGELDAAITEYYRHIYLHPDDEEIREVYIKLGRALRDSGKQPESLSALSTALQRSSTQISRAQTRLELATAHLLFDEPLQAQLVLFRVLASPPADSSITSRAHLLLGVSNVLAQQWSDASKNLTRWADGKPNRLSLRDSLAILLADTSEIPHRSPTLAKVMSAIIPGSGQIYCGEFWDGLNALVLNGALIWSGYAQIAEQRYFAAALVGVPLVGRYYMGNLDHADRYANEFNDRARRAYAARVIRQIANISE